MTSFVSLPIGAASRAALVSMSVIEPTPIQQAAIPPLVEGRDVIGQARTGSGKTLAFVLPLLERLDPRVREVQALILVPTRELAAQVAGVIETVANGRPVRTALIIGGVTLGPQRRALQTGAHVVIGTPGRVLDHLRQGTLRLAGLRLLVLDEADEMLDRGFAPDVERIIAATPPRRQVALFSATVPAWVGQTAAGHLHDPLTVKVDTSSEPVAHVPHTIYDVPDGAKPAALRALLADRGDHRTLVFGRTKHGVRKLAVQLANDGFAVAALQGNLSQNARDRVMADFRSGATPILVATNVAARGLDVEDVSRVINYELPESAALLTHRVGRTGRMGRTGEAITLLTREDEPAWRKLLRELTRQPSRHPWRGRHDQTAGAVSKQSAGSAVAVAAAPMALPPAQPAHPHPHPRPRARAAATTEPAAAPGVNRRHDSRRGADTAATTHAPAAARPVPGARPARGRAARHGGGRAATPPAPRPMRAAATAHEPAVRPATPAPPFGGAARDGGSFIANPARPVTRAAGASAAPRNDHRAWEHRPGQERPHASPPGRRPNGDAARARAHGRPARHLPEAADAPVPVAATMLPRGAGGRQSRGNRTGAVANGATAGVSVA